MKKSDLIEIPILCNTEKSHELEDLGIEISDDNYRTEIGRINLNYLSGYHPAEDFRETIVYLGNNESFVAVMPYVEFDKLVMSRIFE